MKIHKRLIKVVQAIQDRLRTEAKRFNKTDLGGAVSLLY